MSDVQLYRAKSLYKKIKPLDHPKKINMGTDVILDYLKSVQTLNPLLIENGEQPDHYE